MKFERCPDANDSRSSKPFGVEVSGVSNRGRGDIPVSVFVGISRHGEGTRFDESSCGRVESTGCVTSGRRWHRRIPPFVSRFGAAFSLRNADFGLRIEIAD
jgi:hypothetical protein